MAVKIGFPRVLYVTYKMLPKVDYFVRFNIVTLIKVSEYLRTCNIFYLVNGMHITFGIFD